MTLQDAIKSGKDFRRKFDFVWNYLEPGFEVLRRRDGDSLSYFDKESILADDWEVKP